MKTMLTVTTLLVPVLGFAASLDTVEPMSKDVSGIRDVRVVGNARPDPRRDDRGRPDDRRPAPLPAPKPVPVIRHDRVDWVIRAAYREVLEREPDAAGLRNYRMRILDYGWSEENVRAALRDSSEYRGTVVNNIIARAYRDILGRTPDAAGLENYRYKMIARGMTEEGLRRTLIDSDEYRNRLTLIASNDRPRPDGRASGRGNDFGRR